MEDQALYLPVVRMSRAFGIAVGGISLLAFTLTKNGWPESYLWLASAIIGIVGYNGAFFVIYMIGLANGWLCDEEGEIEIAVPIVDPGNRDKKESGMSGAPSSTNINRLIRDATEAKSRGSKLLLSRNKFKGKYVSERQYRAFLQWALSAGFAIQNGDGYEFTRIFYREAALLQAT